MSEHEPGKIPEQHHTPEQWQTKCDEFIEICQYIEQLREQAIQQLMLEEGFDYYLAKSELDAESEEELGEDALMYLQLQETIQNEESYVGKQTLGDNNDGLSLNFYDRDLFGTEEEMTDARMGSFRRLTFYITDDDRIVRYTTDVASGEVTQDTLEVMALLGPDEFEKESLSYNDLKSFIDFLRKISDGIAANLYSQYL